MDEIFLSPTGYHSLLRMKKRDQINAYYYVHYKTNALKT